jgi:hypothetical protein
MSYYERNKEKCKKNALERLHKLKETRNEDIKSYQALYFQLNKERIYKKKPKVEKMHEEPIAETINIKKLIAKLPKEPKEKKVKSPRHSTECGCKISQREKRHKPKAKPITVVYEKGNFTLSFD